MSHDVLVNRYCEGISCATATSRQPDGTSMGGLILPGHAVEPQGAWQPGEPQARPSRLTSLPIHDPFHGQSWRAEDSYLRNAPRDTRAADGFCVD